MTAGKLEFGTLNLSFITAESHRIDIHSTIYDLYDGRRIVSGVSNVGRNPSFNGIAEAESFVNSIINKVGERHNLTCNGIGYGICQIVGFDFNYNRYDGTNNWYNYKLDFSKENLS